MTPVSFSARGMGSGMAPVADGANRFAIAKAFVDARGSRSALDRYPGQPPSSLVDAYAVQDAALDMWSEPVGGWKVGRINPPLDARLGANRLAGPVPASRIIEAGKDAAMTIIDGGFAAGEAEFMVRLAPQSRNTALPTDDGETLEWIDGVRIGVEIAASPYPGINADGPCVTISDHGNNLGLVLGQDVARAVWSSLGDVEIQSFVGSTLVGRANASTMLDGPLGAVRFLLANLAQRGIAPQPGWWVSTGAVTGVHELKPGQTYRAVFAGIGEVACRVEI